MANEGSPFFSRISARIKAFFNSSPPQAPNEDPVPVAENPREAQIEEMILEWTARKVSEGFPTRTEIIEWVVENVEDEFRVKGLEPAVTRATDAALAAHCREQATWSRPTDCDRLDAAFAALEKRGIVARQNFTCCGTCGRDEIRGEIEKFALHSTPVGYTFYHRQDTECAAEGGALYLIFDSVDGSDKAALEVGRAICEALREQELDAQWDGTVKTCVCVTGIEWRKYREPESATIAN